MEWIDTKFLQIAKNDTWLKWLDLLRLVSALLYDKHIENADDSDNKNFVEVEIFDDTDPNTFDETIYTSFKCYTFLVKHINAANLNSIEKQDILSEFEYLLILLRKN